MKKIFWFISFLFTVTIARGQDYNLGFEEWGGTLHLLSRSPNWMETDTCFLPENASDGGVVNLWSVNNGVLRTTDAHSGSYAAVVSIWYTNTTGKLVLGDCGTDINPPDYVPCKNHLPAKLYGISGYYKYVVDSFMSRDLEGTKTMAYIKTYKFDLIADTLAVLSFDSLAFDRSDMYQLFEMPIFYTDSTTTPDSVSIWFESQNNATGSVSCAYAHFLYLDDLEFHYSAMSSQVMENPKFIKKIKIYPNPTKEILQLEYNNDFHLDHIQLIDLSGKTVRLFGRHEKLLHINGLVKGMYFLRIQTKDGLMIEKIIIE